MHLRITFALAVVALSTVALAQNSAQDGPFQVKYFANPVIARGGWSSENLVAHLAPAVLADSTINFTNTASLAHNVTVASSTGSVVGATPTFQGGSRTLALHLKPGTYKFYCSVPGHRQAGMEGTLTVQ